MKIFLKTTLLLMTFAAFLIISCDKQETQDLAAIESQESVTENANSEGVVTRESDEIEGDVCTLEEEDGKGPIDLTVTVTDGVLVFADHDAMMNALHVLFGHNLDAVIEFENQNGYTSLFTEYARIEELPIEDLNTELLTGRYSNIFELTEIEGEESLDLPLYGVYISRILNPDGLVRIGDFIGTIGTNLNIWTDVSNKQELLRIIDSKTLPSNTENFIILDERYFSVDDRADWTMDAACPQDASFKKGPTMFKNPTANRRIKARYEFKAITTPRSNGNRDYTAEFVVSSTSYKGERNKYKTNHYWSADFETTYFTPGSPVLHFQETGQNNCTKYGGKTIHIYTINNTTTAFLIANGVRFLESHPGAEGSHQTGTAVSHRGMGGRYVRFDCD